MFAPCSASEDAAMHASDTWQELIALTRSLADAFKEPTDRSAMLEVVADYERQAMDGSSVLAAARVYGMYTSRSW